MKSKHTFLFLFLFVFVLYSSGMRAQYITTYAGNGHIGHSGDGGGAYAAQLNNPTGVATYGYINVYIADQANHIVRKVDHYGVISTFAGNDTAGYSGDTMAATAARLNTPYGLAVDAANNVYISDYSNNVVRKVNPAGIITTVAGNDSAGYSGDGGSAIYAKLNRPSGIALDLAGNLYIADAQNNVIRKVNTSGIITTIAGNGFGAGLSLGHGGYSGDGGSATDAKLNYPESVAVDKFGNVFIADASNNVIRKVGTNDTISTYAGNGVPGAGGDGGLSTAAGLKFPAGVAVDGPGNVYIADQGNNVVRKAALTGLISTIAGDYEAGYSGDRGLAVSAMLNSPIALTVDGNGLVYVADYNNNVIRLIGPASIINEVKPVAHTLGGLKVYPNPSNGSFTIDLPETNNGAAITVMDMVGKVVANRIIEDTKAQKLTLNLSNIPTGSYILKVDAGNDTYRERIQIMAQ